MKLTIEQIRTLEEAGKLMWDVKDKSKLSCYDVIDAIHTGNILSTSSFLWHDKCFVVGKDWEGETIHLQLCVDDYIWVQSSYHPYLGLVRQTQQGKGTAMQCFYCKSPTMSGKTTRFKEMEKTHLILKDVPCETCSQCGEAFINSATMKEVERIQDHYSRGTASVYLVSYGVETGKPTLEALEKAEKDRAAKEMRAAAHFSLVNPLRDKEV